MSIKFKLLDFFKRIRLFGLLLRYKQLKLQKQYDVRVQKLTVTTIWIYVLTDICILHVIIIKKIDDEVNRDVIDGNMSESLNLKLYECLRRYKTNLVAKLELQKK